MFFLTKTVAKNIKFKKNFEYAPSAQCYKLFTSVILGRALWLITKTRKLRTKKFYNIPSFNNKRYQGPYSQHFTQTQEPKKRIMASLACCPSFCPLSSKVWLARNVAEGFDTIPVLLTARYEVPRVPFHVSVLLSLLLSGKSEVV